MSEKAQKPDWDGTLATNHFHITTLHKYKWETQRSYTYVGLLCGSG